VSEERERVGSWSAALAAVLGEVAAQVGATARRLADGWPDAHGAEWADRLHALGAALDREADAAAGLGRALDRLPGGHDGHGGADGPAASVGDAAVAGSPRLGDTAARRADDRRGVDIPRWGADDPNREPG
jgi:hypothetical protein